MGHYLVLFMLLLSCQSQKGYDKTLLCDTVKEGRFYFYGSPQNEYLLIRDNKYQKEVDMNTGDTSYWKVNWINPCQFELTFFKSSKQLNKQDIAFNKSYKTVINIVEVEKHYYSFETYLLINNKTSSSFRDTAWFQRK